MGITEISSIKMDKHIKGDMLVYKCPHHNCPNEYLTYNDVQSHRVLTHGEVPKFFKIPSASGEGFHVGKLRRLNNYNNKYAIDKYYMMLKLFVNGTSRGKNNGNTKNSSK